MKPNTGDLGSLKKWTNKDREDTSFLGKYNHEIGGPIAEAAMLGLAIVQVISIGKSLFKK
jgi:hypothetical protein